MLALRDRQVHDRCGNNVVAFVQAAMDPVRFIGREEAFSSIQNRLMSFVRNLVASDRIPVAERFRCDWTTTC
jgi:hypothetical protein